MFITFDYRIIAIQQTTDWPHKEYHEHRESNLYAIWKKSYTKVEIPSLTLYFDGFHHSIPLNL